MPACAGVCLRTGATGAGRRRPGRNFRDSSTTSERGRGQKGRGGYRSTPKTMGVVSPRGGWRMGIRAGQRLWCVAGDRAWNRRGREMREVGDARVGDRRSGCGRTGCLTKCQGVRSKSAYGDRSVRSERDQSKLLVVKKPCERERSHGLSLVPARRAKQWLVASIAQPLERDLPGEMRSAQLPARRWVIRDNKFPTTWCRQFTEFARVPPGEQGSSFDRGAWPWPCNEAERRMLPPRDGCNRSTTS